MSLKYEPSSEPLYISFLVGPAAAYLFSPSSTENRHFGILTARGGARCPAGPAGAYFSSPSSTGSRYFGTLTFWIPYILGPLHFGILTARGGARCPAGPAGALARAFQRLHAPGPSSSSLLLSSLELSDTKVYEPLCEVVVLKLTSASGPSFSQLVDFRRYVHFLRPGRKAKGVRDQGCRVKGSRGIALFITLKPRVE